MITTAFLDISCRSWGKFGIGISALFLFGSLSYFVWTNLIMQPDYRLLILLLAIGKNKPLVLLQPVDHIKLWLDGSSFFPKPHLIGIFDKEIYSTYAWQTKVDADIWVVELLPVEPEPQDRYKRNTRTDTDFEMKCFHCQCLQIGTIPPYVCMYVYNEGCMFHLALLSVCLCHLPVQGLY